MSHRREKKLSCKKNKNADINDRILNDYLQEIDDQLKSLRKRIKIIKKLRDAIYSKLI